MVTAPDRISLVLLGLFVPASLLVTFGWFHWWLLLPLSAIGIVLSWRLAPVAPTVDRRATLGAVLALGFAVAWVAGNLPFVSQLLDVIRDPAIYTLEGVWLIGSPTVGVPVQEAQQLAAGIPGTDVNLGNFVVSPDGVARFQGGDLLPGLLAIGGWVFGVKGVLAVNLLLGGAGLVAVYALARRVVGPLWALGAEIALALSLAYLAFSRAPYSEIIMVIVGAAGLVSLIVAIRDGRRSDYLAAGLFFGTATIARIDGPMVVIGGAFVIALASLGFVPEDERRQLLRGSVWYAIGVVPMAALGALDLLLNKPGYVSGHFSQASAIWGLSLVALLLVPVAWWLGRFIAPRVTPTVLRRTGTFLAIAVLLLLLFWLSRPLWYVGDFQNPAQSGGVERHQEREGLEVDGTRSYEEQTFAWIGWYFGWPMLALSIIGTTMMVLRGMRRRDIVPLAVAAMTLTAALLYFTRVSITPDQVWAYRRLLPVITPGFLTAALVVPWALWRRASRSDGARAMASRITAVVAAVVVAFGPLTTWNGLVIAREGTGQLAEISRICDAITTDAVVLIRDSAPANYAMTLRLVCDVQVVSVWYRDLSPAQLRELRDRAGGSIDVVLYNEAAVPEGSALGTPLVRTLVSGWSTAIDHLPDHLVGRERSAWVGTVGPDGTIE